jgi:hypothetical protein
LPLAANLAPDCQKSYGKEKARMSRTKFVLLGMAMGVLGGCATPAGPSAPDGATLSQFTSTPVAGLPQCSQYSVTATVNGKPQPLKGEACRQPDGSWHIAEQPAGGADVYQTVYWPPAGPVAYDACFDDVYDYPCLYDFPFAFSIGFPVFIDVHRHFHPFGGVHRLDDDRFGHFGHVDHFNGLHDGFQRGFAGGVHEGFGGGFHGGGGGHK